MVLLKFGPLVVSASYLGKFVDTLRVYIYFSGDDLGEVFKV